jgi:hypothetical protein
MPDLGKQILVGDVEAAAKALVQMAENFSSNESSVVLSDAEGVPQSLLLYVREDPDKVRSILEVLETWQKQEISK